MGVEFGAVLVVALLVLWRFCRCAHAWELVDKTEIPSRLEVMAKHARATPSFYSNMYESSEVRILIVIRCSKCGAAKILRGNN